MVRGLKSTSTTLGVKFVLGADQMGLAGRSCADGGSARTFGRRGGLCGRTNESIRRWWPTIQARRARNVAASANFTPSVEVHVYIRWSLRDRDRGSQALQHPGVA